MSLRAIEFYSGIGARPAKFPHFFLIFSELSGLEGGLHRALLASGIDGTVVRAFDRDKTACDVYALNVGPDVVHRASPARHTIPDVAYSSVPGRPTSRR